MADNYYIAINGQQEGPFTLEEIRQKNITPDTLVWKSGLPEWIRASSLPELKGYLLDEPIFVEEVVEDTGEKVWFAMIDGVRRIGPHTPIELIKGGTTLTTPVWRPGMTDWQPASSLTEIREAYNNHFNKYQGNNNQGYNSNTHGEEPPYYNREPDFSANPQYKSYNNFHQHNPYNNNQGPYGPNPYRNNMQTNWLPWAIGATVVGFLFSCIGAIFGIIGIVQANKANTLYSQGLTQEADRVNSNAKTMTIIGYVLAGVGLLIVIGFQSTFPTLSYW